MCGTVVQDSSLRLSSVSSSLLLLLCFWAGLSVFSLGAALPAVDGRFIFDRPGALLSQTNLLGEDLFAAHRRRKLVMTVFFVG